MLIALSGYAGTGKDSLADVLVAEHGFKRYAWADTLRIAASVLNPVVGVYLDEQIVDCIAAGQQWVGYDCVRIIRYNEAVERYGYVEAKAKFPILREFLQKLGTDVGRDLISDNVWVDATLGRIARDGNMEADIVFTDTRFPNEADAIRQRGGWVVRMQREGVGPINDHPSETSLDDYAFDATVDNSSPLSHLPGIAWSLVEFLRNSAIGLASSSPY